MNIFPFNRPAFIELIYGAAAVRLYAEQYWDIVDQCSDAIKFLEESPRGGRAGDINDVRLVELVIEREEARRLARLHEAAATCKPFSLVAWKAVK